MKVNLNEAAVTDYLIRHIKDCDGEELARLTEDIIGVESANYDDEADVLIVEYDPTSPKLIDIEEFAILVEQDEHEDVLDELDAKFNVH